MAGSYGETMFYVQLSKKLPVQKDFPGGSVVKNLPTSAGDEGSISGSGRSPGEGNSNPLQYSCLENSMDREAWWATVHGVTKVRHNLVTKPQQKSNY